MGIAHVARIVMEPWQVYTFNRCPILAHLGINISPPHPTLLRKHMLSIAMAFMEDPHSMPSLMSFLDAWDLDWRGARYIMETMPRKRRESLAASALRKLAMFYAEVKKQEDQPNKHFQHVDIDHPTSFGSVTLPYADAPTEIVGMVPFDVITREGQLITLGVYGGNTNLYYPPLSMPQVWAMSVWDGPHITKDFHMKERILNRRVRRDEAVTERLVAYLAGMLVTLNGPVVPGRHTNTCAACNKCKGRYIAFTQEGLQWQKSLPRATTAEQMGSPTS